VTVTFPAPDVLPTPDVLPSPVELQAPAQDTEVASRRRPWTERQLPAPLSRQRVTLYINHDHDSRIVMRRLAQGLPAVTLLVAETGEAGLRSAEIRRPDVIVVDEHLPDISGHDVLRRLREHPATRHLPVVALSANPDRHNRARMLAAGASAYLTKPVNLRELERAIRCLAGLPVS